MYLCGTDPRNTSYGGEQRTHFIWQGLKQCADVYTIVPVPRKYLERTDNENKIYWVCFEQRWTLGWIIWRVIQRFIPRLGFSTGLKSLAHVVGRLPICPDVCVVRHIFMASRFKAWQVAPLIIDSDDLESENYDTHHQHKIKFYHQLVLWYIRQHEKKISLKVRHVWIVNPMHLPNIKSRSILPNISPGEKEDFSNILGDSNTLLFVGYGSSSPNYMGVDSFLTRHWHDLLRVFPNLRLKVVGFGYPVAFSLKWRQYQGIDMLGFVDDLPRLYRDCLCALNPREMGTGSSLKTVEPLAYGRVCVSTVFGARGQTEHENNGVLTFTDTPELIKILSTLQNPNHRIMLQQQARKYNQIHHSQQMVDDIINKTLGKIS